MCKQSIAQLVKGTQLLQKAAAGFAMSPGEGSAIEIDLDKVKSGVPIEDATTLTKPGKGGFVTIFPDPGEGDMESIGFRNSGYTVTNNTKDGIAPGDPIRNVKIPSRLILKRRDGKEIEIALPVNSLDADYVKEGLKTNRKLNDWDFGKLFRVPEYEGTNLDNIKLKIQNMHPDDVTTLYNNLVTLRAGLIDDKVKELRSEGKNLQAFLLKNKDALLSTGAGVAAGSLGYMGTYAGLGLIPYMKEHKAIRFLSSLLAGAGIGGATGYLTNKHLTRYTSKKDKATPKDLLGIAGDSGKELADVIGLSENKK